MQPIYLVCGVPGSGKTWVCEQVSDKFAYVPHDSYAIPAYYRALLRAAKTANKPVLGEAPFRISVLIAELRASGADVRPYFVLEAPEVVKARYETRQGKPIPKQHLTRISTVAKRALQYGAPSGTSDQILEKLRRV